MLERGAQLVARERFEGAHQPLAAGDDRHFTCAESLPRLGHLHAHDAATQHEQPLGHRLGAGGVAAVPDPDVAETVDGWDHWRGTGGEHDRLAGLEPAHITPRRRDVDEALAHQPTPPTDQDAARTLEPFDLAVVLPVAGEVVTPGEHGVDIELPGHGLRGTGHAPHLGQRLTRPEQRLARHACPVRALAADQLGLDHRNARAAFDAPPGDVLTRGTATDHDHVELLALVHRGQSPRPRAR